ncbi:phosphosulfolactate synthase [Rhodohalobacter sulfatireducens]|uniref:Phosphosulfolactate synthase n=1 Tax=Rhodohalobacter sulfatireducens TaxID=2911366 RepID=A0ABS9KA01_9BACT|nr:phosphosulfolactate synthase [Rhodohalobacter sulfatireducens]MCG2587660.1 phosphosulfolactate synthase [Rhodohalobacter sulfatireducens]MDR9366130.1 phosphosulfolactate synthase [Balneolaceae bacterium]MDR9409869.1 phosphosulfolactate synthase [Balneolaceae bacterium]
MSHPISNLPKRTEKPRNKGITLALDKGFSVRQAEDFCEATSNYTDIVKLGWGTSLVTQNLKEKLDVYKNYNIPVYFGGTLFEAYVLRDELDKYVQLLQDHNIEYLEVSNGTIWLSDKRKNEIIKDLSKDFTVLSEVGSKNPDDIIPPYKWVKMIESELEAGAWKVICEARESGTVGVFRPNGEIRSGLIDEIADQISIEHLLFEAPNKDQQVWFIRKFGSNVNLGNIQPAEVISVETLRLGLRSDTLFDFYSIDDKEIRDLYSDNKSDLSQESSS